MANNISFGNDIGSTGQIELTTIESTYVLYKYFYWNISYNSPYIDSIPLKKGFVLGSAHSSNNFTSKESMLYGDGYISLNPSSSSNKLRMHCVWNDSHFWTIYIDFTSSTSKNTYDISVNSAQAPTSGIILIQIFLEK